MKNKLKKLSVFIMLLLSLSLFACTINLGNGGEDVINGIYENNILTSNVTVLTYDYKGTKLAQGSGVIYKYELGYYYAITNNHVVSDGQKFAVYDAFGDIWEAWLINGDKNYDLAVFKFKIKSSNELKIASFSENDPEVNEKVISVTNANGVINTVTLGKVKGYRYLNAIETENEKSEELSNVNFKIIHHDAPIESGSSGGALFNYNYELCGINFASGRDSNGNYLSSFAVQVSKVREFLNSNGL